VPPPRSGNSGAICGEHGAVRRTSETVFKQDRTKSDAELWWLRISDGIHTEARQEVLTGRLAIVAVLGSALEVVCSAQASCQSQPVHPTSISVVERLRVYNRAVSCECATDMGVSGGITS
jgi:hypothetical protein